MLFIKMLLVLMLLLLFSTFCSYIFLDANTTEITSEITYVYWQVQQVFNFFYSVTLKDVNFELGVNVPVNN